ncbi:recombinase RecT [Vibrio parahaemolyticus]|nr:recombinase RecT [Vibrio parahaemolyticus]
MIFSAFSNLDLHKSFTLNDAIIQAYANMASRQSLVFGEHYSYEAFNRLTNTSESISGFNSKMLNEYFVMPVISAGGLSFIRDNTEHLKVTAHNLLREDTISLNHHSLVKSETPSSMRITGCMFCGEYRGNPIYGYVSIDEALALAGLSEITDMRIINALLFETAMYRAMQRVDRVLLPEHFIQFQELHELRNFVHFRSNTFNHEAFKAASEVISSREDYLRATSKVWNRDFHAQLTFLSFSIAELAGKRNVPLDEIRLITYKTAGDAASENANMSPINGSHYLLALTDEESQTLSVVVRETVNGRLKRCYEKAGLEHVKADAVYSNDDFDFDSKQPVRHLTSSYNNLNGKRGNFIGAYCSLVFNDQSIHSEFVDSQEILEIAECSEIDTWEGIFADRMSIKHAISSALSTCDWDHKTPTVAIHGYH